jgi:hypothetical protein
MLVVAVLWKYFNSGTPACSSTLLGHYICYYIQNCASQPHRARTAAPAATTAAKLVTTAAALLGAGEGEGEGEGLASIAGGSAAGAFSIAAAGVVGAVVLGAPALVGAGLAGAATMPGGSLMPCSRNSRHDSEIPSKGSRHMTQEACWTYGIGIWPHLLGLLIVVTYSNPLPLLFKMIWNFLYCIASSFRHTQLHRPS